MGIFDKIKFKKDEQGETVEKSEKSEISDIEGRVSEVDKAAKVLPVVEGEQNRMKKDSSFFISSVIVRPLITEKSAHLASENKYVFEISPEATRVDVRRSIKSMYGITPVAVNVSNKSGKFVRFGQRIGKRKDWKKAIVTLPKGTTINVYEGV